MAFSLLEQSLLYTLAYTTQFQFPLTPFELKQRLIFKLGDQELLGKTPTQVEITTAIKHLLQLRLISQQNGYLVLAGFEETAQVRDRRLGYAAARQPEINEVVRIAKQCPWVAAVYMTGSMAMANGEKDADIDFLIVTSPGRLWLTRLWLLWQAMRRGKRRSWQGEEKGSWCFNLWVESDQLAIFGQQTSLYTAYELIQAQLVFSRHEKASGALLAANQWAKAYLPLANQWAHLAAPRSQFKPVGWLSLLNRLAYLFQWVYMSPHRTREKVALQWAFFHPRDTQAWIYRGWSEVLKKVTISL